MLELSILNDRHFLAVIRLEQDVSQNPGVEALGGPSGTRRQTVETA